MLPCVTDVSLTFPLLQGQLLTLPCGDKGDCSAVMGPIHNRWPPRTFPPIRIPPSQLDITTGHPVATKSRCPSPDTQMAGPESQEEGVPLALWALRRRRKNRV